MSDYFSVKPVPSGGGSSGGGTPADTVYSSKLLTPSYSNMGNMINSDNASINSNGSQYLMDMIPDSLTLKDNATSSNFNTKDYILPKTDVRSPYYIDVPIPNPLASKPVLNANPTEDVTIDSADDDGYLVKEFPTTILIDRFYKWKKILKSIISYLREVAYAQEQFARINHQLKGAVNFPFLTDIQDGSHNIVDPLFAAKRGKKQQPLTLAQQKEVDQQKQMEFDLENSNISLSHPQNSSNNTPAASGFMRFGSGSIQDIQVILKKHHLALASQQFKVSKEISSTLVPKLETLKKDLNFKIKEIKELHGDFKTNITAHIKLTSHLLNKYIAAVNLVTRMSNGDNITDTVHLQPKHDPFLLKLQLDVQLKRQLSEENYLQEAYVNLQTTGLKLEKIIYSKIQHTLQRYSYLIDAEARLMIKNLCQELQHGMLSKPPALEWDHFVSHHPLCLMNLKSNYPLPRPRKLSDIIYPNMKTSMAKCIRAGYFEKKSEYMKEYKKGYFVLTVNYLHEFKSSNFFNNSGAPASISSTATTPPVLAASSSNNSPQLGNTMDMTNSNSPPGNTKVINPKKVNSLTPILSIPLNECTLTEYSDTHFTLTGKATFIDLQKSKTTSNLTSGGLSSKGSTSNTFTSIPTKNNSSSPSLKQLENDYAKIISKKSASSLSKLLLKPVRTKQAKKDSASKKEIKRKQNEYNNAIELESNKIVTWVFKSLQDTPSEEEKRHFKKWILDLKNLCGFNTTRERVKFLDDRIEKTQLQRQKIKYSSTGNLVGSSNNDSTLVSEAPSLYETTDMVDNYTTQSFGMGAPGTAGITPVKSSKSTNRPQYIPIQNTSAMDLNYGFRSKVNTPSIDDNGNLITLAERKSAYVRSGSVASLSPQPRPNPAQSLDLSHVSDPSILNTMSSYSAHPGDVSITSNGLNIQDSVQPSHQMRQQNSHQRNISLPTTLAAFSPVHSPTDLSMDSENSQGGYFAIPINEEQQSDYQNMTMNNAPISLYNDDQIKPITSLSLSRTSSRGYRTSRQPSSSSIHGGNVMTVPKVHLNNQELKGLSLTKPVPVLQKQYSTGSLPVTKVQTPTNETSETPLVSPHAPLYQRGNGSATNLSSSNNATSQTPNTRVHSYRKHKKNVSFSSLNSLMFSKKNGAYGYNSGNLMSGGIQEDEPSEETASTSGIIKLNQSIYQ